MTDRPPRWRRRSAERPAEIAEAALAVFAELGFAAASLEEIARRAGVSKATLYLYFENKEAVFRGAVSAAAAPLLAAARGVHERPDAPFHELAPALLQRAAAVLSAGRAAALARMVIAESRTFPDLARIWHADVIAPALGVVTQLVARAQQRGEIPPGEPRLVAFSLVGPLVLGALYREVFGDVAADGPDLSALAAEHAILTTRGLTRIVPEDPP